MKKLVVVESPTKAKTIERFLGKDYTVVSSFGHVRDLPKNKLGVDVDHDFKPTYVIPTKIKKTVTELKKSAKKADTFIMATDGDREGEAIAWHLVQALGLNEGKSKNEKGKTIERIVFHEITNSAIEEALAHPREIDMSLVDAQQARRILDRLVGYNLSPFLWKKVAKGLSAGRVQSVAVRLIAEREKEIEKYVPNEYWSIVASLLKIKNEGGETDPIEAILIKAGDKIIPKLGTQTKSEAETIINDLEGAEYTVESIEKKSAQKYPFAPYTTSTLQQDAWRRLRMSAKFTMRIAQQLYEGKNLGKGAVGLITYMRTDSVNIATSAQVSAQKFIEHEYGKDYHASRIFKTKSRLAQEAHEAIRPTEPARTPESVKEHLDARQYKLYELIWRRFIASQMTPARFDATSITIQAKTYTFRTHGQTLTFDGFLKVYSIKFEETMLPELNEGEILNLQKLISEQHFTKPPGRYTEATLVKKLEKEGIGRPSTYAPIMSTIQDRRYIEKDEQKRFRPTEIGTLVNDMLVKHFPQIVDIAFTAHMEENLDKIAEGRTEWVPVIRTFYDPFKKNLEQKYEKIEKKDLTEETDEICEKCGKPMIIKYGRFGKFMACTGFPNCKNTKSIEKSTGVPCPKCGKGEISEKKSKRKRTFYGCNQWPKCDFALWSRPTGEKCPECGSLLVEERNQNKCSNKECGWANHE